MQARRPLLMSLSHRLHARSPLYRESSSSSAAHPAEPIHILGIGNIGNLIAHSLARVTPAPPVVLLLHRPGLLPEWEKVGRCIDVVTDRSSDKQRGFTAVLVSKDNGATGGIIKNLVVATKTHAASAAIQPLKHRLSNESTILFLQNGMGIHGIYKPGPFSIVHAGHGTTTISAVLPPNTNHTEPKPPDPTYSIPEPSRYLLHQLLRAPTLAATVVTPTELFYAQLEKLVVNAMINPLTVIFNCHNGQLLGRPPIAALMLLLLAEAAAVVRALALSPSRNTGDDKAALESRFSQPVLEQFVRSVAVKTAQNISSMLQDVRADRKTEVDYINGYIVARGAELGIDCVHNRTLVQMVKDRRVISEDQISEFFPGG
ncbi:MAG: 2-dehydropantoate 2-reductase (Ketopantoate reductase) (KPA reductase) (KPR) [Geoglossum umbratile]|nr:MAG: 2-dehydropantoate 2-reductase (Ketopantoate reductase) (KPA reductase) (KPR) [Geoglossum umbratile]